MYQPKSKCDAEYTPQTAAAGVEGAIKILEGRWKMRIIFQLFTNEVMRFSALERAIPDVSQKMLIQQLRELERDHVICRKIYPEVPPKVEYFLTELGRALCPALRAILDWAEKRQAYIETLSGESSGA